MQQAINRAATKSGQRGLVGIALAIWLAVVIGWVANIVQFFQQMPPTMAEATPFWIAKGVCIFIAPVGSILGYMGFFA